MIDFLIIGLSVAILFALLCAIWGWDDNMIISSKSTENLDNKDME